MKKVTAILNAVVLGAALGASGGAFASSTVDHSPSVPGKTEMGSGMSGAGMMKHHKGPRHGKVMGSGMMGQNMGHGMMMGRTPSHYGSQDIDRNLSAEDVRKVLDGRFVWMGHKRLKVGDVKKQDDGTLLANIDTVDGSLVMRMKVNPKTGEMLHLNE